MEANVRKVNVNNSTIEVKQMMNEQQKPHLRMLVSKVLMSPDRGQRSEARG